jgi:hypothetical protein
MDYLKGFHMKAKLWVGILVEYPSLWVRNKVGNKKESRRVSLFVPADSPVTAWYTGGSMAELIGILRGEDRQALKHHTMRGSVKQMTKKKRVPRAQSRLALARFRQQQREQRQQTAAHRAQERWNKTSCAERHVRWMIDHHGDDHGHRWPDRAES